MVRPLRERRSYKNFSIIKRHAFYYHEFISSQLHHVWFYCKRTKARVRDPKRWKFYLASGLRGYVARESYVNLPAVTLEDLHARNERENVKRETVSCLYGLPDVGETPEGSLRLGEGKSIVYWQIHWGLLSILCRYYSSVGTYFVRILFLRDDCSCFLWIYYDVIIIDLFFSAEFLVHFFLFLFNARMREEKQGRWTMREIQLKRNRPILQITTITN